MIEKQESADDSPSDRAAYLDEIAKLERDVGEIEATELLVNQRIEGLDLRQAKLTAECV